MNLSLRIFLTIAALLTLHARPALADQDQLARFLSNFIFHARKIFIPAKRDEAMATKLLEGITVKLADLDLTQQGVCVRRGWNKPEIWLRKRTWETLSDGDRESLVFHELGHCVLGRPHRDDQIVAEGRKIPASLMKAEAFSDKIYLQYRDYYISELFAGTVDLPTLREPTPQYVVIQPSQPVYYPEYGSYEVIEDHE